MMETKSGGGIGRKARVAHVCFAVFAVGACNSGTSDKVDTFVPQDTLSDTDILSDADTDWTIDERTEPPDEISPNDDEISDIDEPDVPDEVGPDTETDVATAPPTLWLTVAQIPVSMNGSRPTQTPTGPLDYGLRVNRHGFQLDVVATDVDWNTLDLECTTAGAPLVLPAVAPPSPGSVRGQPTFARETDWRQLHIRDFPVGRMTCTASIASSASDGSHGHVHTTYTFDAADLPAALDPFPQTDIWVVQTDRDIFRMQPIRLPDGSEDLRTMYLEGGDGIDDFDAPLFELGLMSRTSPTNAKLVRDHLLRKVKAHVQAIYDLDVNGHPQGDVDIAILFEGDTGTPDPADFDGTNFSRIALTGDGDPDDQLAGLFGRALIDWNNQNKEDDAVVGLGVWPTALARGILRNSLGILLLEPYRPAQGGIAFGDHPDDHQFLGKDDVDPATLTGDAVDRHTIYDLVIDLASMALASILAHEIGHSVGLVPPGPPPQGLFAGLDVDFVVSVNDDAHIDTEGLNVMQTGSNLNITEALNGEHPRFEPLSWAYLRRQLVVGP